MVVSRAPWGLAVCIFGSLLHGFVSEEASERKQDSVVIASLRLTLAKAKDAADPSAMFLDEAAVHVDLGPAQPAFTDAIGKHLPHYPTLRGKEEIKAFFTSLAKAHVQIKHPYEDSGEYAPQLFVVDDNQVVLAGKFGSDRMSGRVQSETWIRVGGLGDTWKMRTAMYVVDVADVARMQRAQNSETLPVFLSTVAPMQKDTISQKEVAHTTPSPTTPLASQGEPGSHMQSGHTWVLIILGIGFVLALCYFEHRRRRKAAQWMSINTVGDVWLG
jgi:hypothetical protein